VRLDLAQRMDLAATGGVSAAYSGIAINASLTIGYGYDYRAAALCKTIIHAIPADPQLIAQFLARAAEFADRPIELPDKTTIDRAILDQSARVPRFDEHGPVERTHLVVASEVATLVAAGARPDVAGGVCARPADDATDPGS
jgi:hypothetical protein